jgi:hypothetical protein
MKKRNGKGKKNSKRTVRCTMCTEHRWLGNHKERFDLKTRRRKEQADHERQLRENSEV